MKHLTYVTALLLIVVSSCRKDMSEAAAPNSAANRSAASSIANVANTTTLTLQPGPTDGNDLWMKNWKNHPAYADTCDAKVALVKGLAYSLNGSLVTTRSVIKFNGLSNVPANASIQSATLYLYGPTPSSKDVSKHLPMGNTSYPGSTKGDNTCLLQRITSPWNANTISWNNPPVASTADQLVLVASNKQWQYDIATDVTEMVKQMVSNTSSNNGFLLRLKTEQKPRAMGFLSSDSPEQNRRPKLVVTYSL